MIESTLLWWIAGPVIGLVIVPLIVLANKRLGVGGGVTDRVHGSSQGAAFAAGARPLVRARPDNPT